MFACSDLIVMVEHIFVTLLSLGFTNFLANLFKTKSVLPVVKENTHTASSNDTFSTVT